MKRILVVENGAGFGGALTSLETLLSGLDPARWEVHLLTSYPQQAIQARGAVRRTGVVERKRRYGSGSGLEAALRPVIGRLSGNVSFVIDHLSTGRVFANCVARYARDNGVDVIQGNNGVLINDAVILAARQAGKPCVIHSRGAEYSSRVGGWLSRGAAKFVAVSGYVADTVKALGVDPGRISLVPEGLDAEGFARGTDAQAFRLRHGLPEDVPLVGLVACLVGWKGHDVFLDACAQVLPKTGAYAVVVGGEPDGSGEMQARLRAVAKARGIGERVCFTGHESDVASAMAACQVVVHASTSPEPFGRVILEAMAVGRPVVASRAGGPAEVVAHGRDGLLVPPGDAQAMGEAVEVLLGDASLREHMGLAGLKKVRGLYRIEDHVARMEAVWDNVAG
jgi:glycosyltransferase involved in cell wall biosynthesis